jgi:putative flavoprotein involved in K+ transport
MFKRTPQPGLWFIAGSLAQCRIYSKYLALQIKACEAGLLPLTRDAAEWANAHSRILAGASASH